MRIIFFTLCFIISVPAFAQVMDTPEPIPEKAPVVEAVEKEIKEIPQEVRTSAYFRDQSTGTAMVGYHLIESWIPFKWTAGYTHNFNARWTLEGEYSRGKFGIGWFGFDAASVTEQRYSLLARRFVGNSFHWIFGAYKNDFHAQLGSGILDDIDNSGIKDFRVQAIGASLGFGNRWQWESGFTFGIDWFRINVPLFDKKVDSEILDKIDNDNDLSVVKDAIDKVKSTPTFVLFGLHLGYSF